MTLRSGYLRGAETPFQLLVRVAAALGQGCETTTRDIATQLVRREMSFATPVLFHAGVRGGNLASCFLLSLEGHQDNVDGIWTTMKDLATVSSACGGLGIAASAIGSAAAEDTGGLLRRFLRPLNEMLVSVNPGQGKRRSSCAVYLEMHHPALLTFLEMRQTHGNPQARCHDLFSAVWVSDLFMQRARAGAAWSFIDARARLDELWGDAYATAYAAAERDATLVTHTMPAREVLRAVLDAQVNAGTPYVLFKDTANATSNQQNLGTIRCSNLCAEIVEFSSAAETAVCTLGSVSLPAFVRKGGGGGARGFDFAGLMRTARNLVRHLNEVIDVTTYPLESAQRSNLKHRPVGIGVSGLADVFFRLRVVVGSPEALQLDRDIFAALHYAAVEASVALAKEHGPYASFPGSPASEGKLQWDLWHEWHERRRGAVSGCVPPTEPPTAVGGGDEEAGGVGGGGGGGGGGVVELDWPNLRAAVKKHGLRNSLLTAAMPTASTAQILGNSESFDPIVAFMATRRTKCGDHLVINPPLRDRLQALGLWNANTIHLLLRDNGSVARLKGLSDDDKAIFRTAWEIKQRCLLEHAAARGPFICQSQSLNIFMKNHTAEKLTSLHFLSWKLGLKTSTYYLRVQDPSNALPITVSASAAAKASNDDAREEECLSCSA